MTGCNPSHEIPALLLVLAAVFLRRRKCLLNVFAVLAAAALALTGFAVFRDLRVVPIRALAGETQEITADRKSVV